MTDTTSREHRNIPDGAELVDSDVLAQLRKDSADLAAARGEAAQLRAEAEAGRKAQAELRKQRHEALVNDAIKAGKFGPARRAGWLKALQIDEPGTLEDLEALPSGLVPVDQVGHAGDVDGEENLYDRAFNSKEH
ncbi:hypothetical protein M4D54_09200 [Brachybacterium sp. p3-SID1565]|uniref:Uncharacterized protein n=1 Tax=Brachybacterium epidermidis TaxID=2781983 RepID=A0ABR9W252_9MICO|nr:MULTISPECIES: hypothetical protein [Brachybacterium]MBE9404504.1 hypothetical protein [Brachybacterium epidermidis]MCT1385799.1 hypothetical protein [Brachybacterium sp. p3-SID1565]